MTTKQLKSKKLQETSRLNFSVDKQKKAPDNIRIYRVNYVKPFLNIKNYSVIILQLIIRMSTDKYSRNRQDLRVLQKNMVYCSGLPSNLTKDQLTSESYFGQYGKIEKIVINVFPNRNYCSVYLTYSHQFEAATTILACNEFEINRSTLWCLFGTMKYCKFFLKKIQCKNLSSCPYMHAFDYKNQIEIQTSPAHAFPYHQKLAKEVLRKHPQKIQKLREQNKPAGQLPEPLYALQFMQPQSIQIVVPQPQQKQSPIEINREIESNQEQNIEEQEIIVEEQPPIDIEYRIKKLILTQIEKAKGSRLMGNIKSQGINVKQIIVSGLLD